METKGRSLHKQAADARESGNLTESLHLSDEALLAYDQEDDSLGFAEGISNRSITLRILSEQTESRRIKIIAMHEMMASVQIARESGQPDAVALPLYNLAKLQEELGDVALAVTTYKESIAAMQHNPPKRHDRPSIILDMQIHMSACEFKTGDTAARERLEQYLAELEQTDESKFEKDVWVSGGYMKLAESYRQDSPEKAKQNLDTARKIIESNPNLVLRKQQLEKLAATFEIT